MTAFVEGAILICAHDLDAGLKRARDAATLRELLVPGPVGFPCRCGRSFTLTRPAVTPEFTTRATHVMRCEPGDGIG